MCLNRDAAPGRSRYTTAVATEATIASELRTALAPQVLSDDLLAFLVKTIPRKAIEEHLMVSLLPIGMKRSSTGRVKDKEEEIKYPPLGPKEKGKGKVSPPIQRRRLTTLTTEMEKEKWRQELKKLNKDLDAVKKDFEIRKKKIERRRGKDEARLKGRAKRELIENKRIADLKRESYIYMQAIASSIEEQLDEEGINRNRPDGWWVRWTGRGRNDLKTKQQVIDRIGWDIPTADNPKVINQMVRIMGSFNSDNTTDADVDLSNFATLVMSDTDMEGIFRQFYRLLHLPIDFDDIMMADQYQTAVAVIEGAVEWIETYGKLYDYPERYEVSDAEYKMAMINSISLGPLNTMMGYLIGDLGKADMYDTLANIVATGKAPRFQHMQHEMDFLETSFKKNMKKRHEQIYLRAQLNDIEEGFNLFNHTATLNDYRQMITPAPPDTKYRVPLDLYALVRAVTAMSKGRTLGMTRLRQIAFHAILVGGTKRLTDVYAGLTVYQEVYSETDRQNKIYPYAYWGMTGALFFRQGRFKGDYTVRRINMKHVHSVDQIPIAKPTDIKRIIPEFDIGHIYEDYPIWFDSTLWDLAVKIVHIALNKTSTMTHLANSIYAPVSRHHPNQLKVFPKFPEGLNPFQTIMAVYLTRALYEWDTNSPLASDMITAPVSDTPKPLTSYTGTGLSVIDYWERILGSSVDQGAMWHEFYTFVMKTVQYTAPVIEEKTFKYTTPQIPHY